MLVQFKANLECQRLNVLYLYMPTMSTEPDTERQSPFASSWPLRSCETPMGSPWAPATNKNLFFTLFSIRVFSGALFKLILTSSFSFSQNFKHKKA